MGQAEGAIELAKSGLRIEAGSLLKCAGDGKTVGRHRLEDIDDVRLAAAWEPVGVVALLADIALWGAALVLGLSDMATAALLVGGAAIGLFGVTRLRSFAIVMEVGGAGVWYKVAEDFGDASGFVATLRALVAEERRSAGAKWGQPG